jgi:site-specific DNA-methyltransferase (adenine-specific)
MFVLTKGKEHTFNSLNDRPCQNPGSWRRSHTKRQRDGRLSAYKRPSTEATTQRDNVWRMPNNHLASTPDKLAFAHPAIFPEKLAADHILS